MNDVNKKTACTLYSIQSAGCFSYYLQLIPCICGGLPLLVGILQLVPLLPVTTTTSLPPFCVLLMLSGSAAPIPTDALVILVKKPASLMPEVLLLICGSFAIANGASIAKVQAANKRDVVFFICDSFLWNNWCKCILLQFSGKTAIFTRF